MILSDILIAYFHLPYFYVSNNISFLPGALVFPLSIDVIYTFSLRIKTWHDDIIKWKHFPRYWPFVRGIHRSPVNSPHKGQWRGALMFSLICIWINGWVNNREAGDLRRHRAHYDVIVMKVWKRICAFGPGYGFLPEPIRIYCQLEPWEQTTVTFVTNYNHFIKKELKCRL